MRKYNITVAENTIAITGEGTETRVTPKISKKGFIEFYEAIPDGAAVTVNLEDSCSTPLLVVTLYVIDAAEKAKGVVAEEFNCSGQDLTPMHNLVNLVTCLSELSISNIPKILEKAIG